MQERWRELEDLYHRALEQPEDRRNAFLTNACDGDETLLRELQSLLRYQKQAEPLMERDAINLAAESMAKDGRRFCEGQSIGSYDIVSLIGAGGMGQVYRARDLKLKRDVAIKVLSPEFSSDTERVRRLRREAELLASLNHPNIGAIYDFGELGGCQFLVLEFVEGETLADRTSRSPIPLDQSLDIARQIGEALETAHEQGVIHRDLKPANIKVKPDGSVKVIDFGLAKAFDTNTSNRNLSNSPTLKTIGGTSAGVILGTAAYMSPEHIFIIDN